MQAAGCSDPQRAIPQGHALGNALICLLDTYERFPIDSRRFLTTEPPLRASKVDFRAPRTPPAVLALELPLLGEPPEELVSAGRGV